MSIGALHADVCSAKSHFNFRQNPSNRTRVLLFRWVLAKTKATFEKLNHNFVRARAHKKHASGMQEQRTKRTSLEIGLMETPSLDDCCGRNDGSCYVTGRPPWSREGLLVGQSPERQVSKMTWIEMTWISTERTKNRLDLGSSSTDCQGHK